MHVESVVFLSLLSSLPVHVGPSFIIRLYKTKIFTSKVYQNISRSDTFAELSLPQPVPLCGDIKIEFFHNQRLGGKEKMFHFWFNTFFVDMHVMMQEAQYLEDHRQVVTTVYIHVCVCTSTYTYMYVSVRVCSCIHVCTLPVV